MGKTFKDNREFRVSKVKHERASDLRFKRGLDAGIWNGILEDWKEERETKKNFNNRHED